MAQGSLAVLYPDSRWWGYRPAYGARQHPVMCVAYPDGPKGFRQARRGDRTSRPAVARVACRRGARAWRHVPPEGGPVTRWSSPSDKGSPFFFLRFPLGFEQELPRRQTRSSRGPFGPGPTSTAERIAKAVPNLGWPCPRAFGSPTSTMNAAIAGQHPTGRQRVKFCKQASAVAEGTRFMQILALVRNFLPLHDWVTKADGTSPTAWSGV